MFRRRSSRFATRGEPAASNAAMPTSEIVRSGASREMGLPNPVFDVKQCGGYAVRRPLDSESPLLHSADLSTQVISSGWPEAVLNFQDLNVVADQYMGSSGGSGSYSEYGYSNGTFEVNHLHFGRVTYLSDTISMSWSGGSRNSVAMLLGFQTNATNTIKYTTSRGNVNSWSFSSLGITADPDKIYVLRLEVFPGPKDGGGNNGTNLRIYVNNVLKGSGSLSKYAVTNHSTGRWSLGAFGSTGVRDVWNAYGTDINTATHRTVRNRYLTPYTDDTGVVAPILGKRQLKNSAQFEFYLRQFNPNLARTVVEFKLKLTPSGSNWRVGLIRLSDNALMGGYWTPTSRVSPADSDYVNPEVIAAFTMPDLSPAQLDQEKFRLEFIRL